MPTAPTTVIINPDPIYDVLMAIASPEKKNTMAKKLQRIHPLVRW